MVMVALFIGTWALLVGFFFFGLWPYLKRTAGGAEKERWTQGL